MASMTEESVLQMCAPTFDEADIAGWSQRILRLKIEGSKSNSSYLRRSTAISGHHLIAVDELASWQEKGSHPALEEW